MENDLLINMGCWDSENSADVLKDHETKWNIFPEEACLQVQSHLGGICWVLRNHGEWNTTVTEVRVKDPLKAALVCNLTFVHSTNSFGDWQNLSQLKVRESLAQVSLESLNLSVKHQNLVFRCIVEVFIKLWHL